MPATAPASSSGGADAAAGEAAVAQKGKSATKSQKKSKRQEAPQKITQFFCNNWDCSQVFVSEILRQEHSSSLCPQIYANFAQLSANVGNLLRVVERFSQENPQFKAEVRKKKKKNSKIHKSIQNPNSFFLKGFLLFSDNAD